MKIKNFIITVIILFAGMFVGYGAGLLSTESKLTKQTVVKPIVEQTTERQELLNPQESTTSTSEPTLTAEDIELADTEQNRPSDVISSQEQEIANDKEVSFLNNLSLKEIDKYGLRQMSIEEKVNQINGSSLIDFKLNASEINTKLLDGKFSLPSPTEKEILYVANACLTRIKTGQYTDGVNFENVTPHRPENVALALFVAKGMNEPRLKERAVTPIIKTQKDGLKYIFTIERKNGRLILFFNALM